jgi:hypothetical protein
MENACGDYVEVTRMDHPLFSTEFRRTLTGDQETDALVLMRMPGIFRPSDDLVFPNLESAGIYGVQRRRE